ncbi:hypothetical protein SEA_ZOOMAN_52 [Microbacterium phage Zooman]|nr:hypothetical protein SEA_ZOOMAN_52 [Microbacterium phage Zooman]
MADSVNVINWEELPDSVKVGILLRPGTKLYGYCNGYFGRDSYGDKTVLASGEASGKVWVVVDDEYFGPILGSDFNPDLVIGWIQPEEEEEEEPGYGPLY